jgi:hypothetical protein
VVGQQVALSIQPGLAPGQLTQTWTVPPTTAPLPISGYPATTAECSTENNCPTPADFTQPTTTFYWVSAGKTGKQTYNVQYSYSPSATGTTPVSATFTLYGPTGVESVVTNTGGPGKQPIQIVGNAWLGFGAYQKTLNKYGLPGITFDSSKILIPVQFTGNFQWVQIVETGVVTYYNGIKISKTCNPKGVPGIDASYPYGLTTPTTTSDSPGAALTSNYSSITDSNSFISYLQWAPSTFGDDPILSVVPVTLGYVKWSWNGDAVQSASGVWSVDQSNSSFTVSPYVVSGIEPTWTSTATAACR